MAPWPWQKENIECKHLIKYDGKSVELSGISASNLFQLGKVAIEPKLLQAVSQALMLIDASQYYLCESVNNAPDDETKKRYYEMMMQDRLRAQDIIMGLAALTINPQSKSVEEGIMNMLLKNHNRALQIEDEEKIKVNVEPLGSNSATVQINNSSFKDKINELEKSQPSYSNQFEKAKVQSNFSKTESVGLFHLLKEKFNVSGLKTLCFEYGLDYDDIPGENKEDKVRELILNLKRRDKLDDFYEFVREYLARSG